MPVVAFNQLPADARVWIFASDRPLRSDDAKTLLDEVDGFLAQWKAHGAPLRAGREWRDDRFLVIGVDPTAEQASGCSIDGLFRGLQALERSLATRLVGGGRVFYRDSAGTTGVASRADAPRVISGDTAVFDTALTDAASYRSRFERPARDTWVAALLTQSSQPSSRSATNSSSVRKG
jgi:hypothetical protein